MEYTIVNKIFFQYIFLGKLRHQRESSARLVYEGQVN